METTNNIANFIKYQRKKLGMTQEELAEKAGVGLRFIREVEQGKQSLRMDKVNQVLALFGHKLLPENGMNAYDILYNYLNKNVKIYLKNKSFLVGFIMEGKWENNKIESWDFVSNNDAIEYQQTQNKKLIFNLKHEDIEKVEFNNPKRD
jgi:y4mF family transcriptional regulator